MSAPTTAAEVLAAHRLDQETWLIQTDPETGLQWIEHPCDCDGWQGEADDHAAHQADALREAGPLAETTTEWGVRWPWAHGVEPNTSEGSARWRAVHAHTRDGIVVRREVSEWIDTTAASRQNGG